MQQRRGSPKTAHSLNQQQLNRFFPSEALLVSLAVGKGVSHPRPGTRCTGEGGGVPADSSARVETRRRPDSDSQTYRFGVGKQIVGTATKHDHLPFLAGTSRVPQPANDRGEAKGNISHYRRMLKRNMQT